MLLTPRLAYQREFFGEGLCNFGPACALFRREEFVSIGGFPELGSHSDTLFWLRIFRRVNVLLVYGDLYWYRIHAAQEMTSVRAAYDGAAVEWKWLDALNSTDCPLLPDECERARRNAVGRILRSIVRDLRRGHPQLAWFRIRHARLSWREWLRYAGRPHVALDAGTPRTSDGNPVINAVLRIPRP